MTLDEFITRAIPVPFAVAGRDYSGWDCYGLIYCAYRDVFGRLLPEYSSEYKDDLSYRELHDMLNSEKPTWIETDMPFAGDVGLYKVGPYNSHVTLVLPNRRMIHCEQRAGTIVERLDSMIWARRNVGYWRKAG